MCLNTLGQDRPFTDEEKKFALRCVQNFRDIWEKNEKESLRFDIEKRLEQIEIDKHYKEHFESLDNAEMEIRSEQAASPKDEDHGGEEQRQQMLKRARYGILQRTFFAPEEAALQQKQIERERLRAA